MRNVRHTIELAPRRSIVWLISLYQHTLSPDHGPLKHLHPYGFCRHEPTCSEYGKGAIEEHGIFIGGMLLARRLASCHPWKDLSDGKILSMLQKRCSKG